MPLSQATLASELASLVPTANEAVAVANLTTAWTNYFSGASVSGVPIASGPLNAAKSSFQGALAGMSGAGAAAVSIQNAVTAFWAALVSTFAANWTIPPNTVIALVPPPTLGGIAAALTAMWSANSQNPNMTLQQAANSMASVLHTNGGLGGIATVQPPPPAPPAPVPVL